ncbi:Uncharacterised protein [Clostridioides difficile]|nr:Uncharacterised protein [Clostridioides difficile]
MFPVKSSDLLSFSTMYFEIASFNSSPDKSAKSLSAKYFNFTSFGVPSNPFVYAGDTTGSANSHILPTGSLKAPSP